MVVVRPGDWVWLSADASSSFQVPIGCQVKSVSKSNEVTVSDDEGRSYTFNLVKAASRNHGLFFIRDCIIPCVWFSEPG